MFAKIGTTHGAGNGSTTFNVPDLRGVFIRGTGTSASIGGETYSGGALGAKQADATSKNGLTLTDSGHNHSNTSGGSFVAGGTGTSANVTSGGGTFVFSTLNSSTSNITLNAGDSETRPANISLTPCIWTVSNPATMLVGSVIADTNVKAEKGTGITTVDYGSFLSTVTAGTNAVSVTSPAN